MRSLKAMFAFRGPRRVPGTAVDRLVDRTASIALAVAGNGTVQRMSAKAREVLGYASGDTVRLGDVLPGFTSPRALAGCAESPTLAVRRCGAMFTASVACTRVRCGFLSWRYVVVFGDENARAESEARLRAAASLLSSVLEAVTDPVFVRDGEGRFTAVNGAGARALGLPLDEIEGRRAEDLPIEDWVARSLGDDREAAADGKVRLSSIRVSDGGDPHWFSSTSYPMPGNGGVITIAREITDDVRGIAALDAAKQKAESAHTEKSRFLYSVGHDLRQPVQAILLQTAMLALHAGPRGEAAANALTRSASTVKDLLDSLLELCQIDSGAVRPNIVPFRLDGLLDDIAAAAAPSAAEKGLGFSVSGIGATVWSDRVRLGQMILNLVQNAIRYTDRGSVTVSCERRGSHVCILVSDTGIGIPEDRLASIWGEFVQLGHESQDSEGVRGLGLGLSIVGRLGRLLSHYVDVASSPGNGSTFLIHVTEAADPEQEKPVDTVPRIAQADRNRAVCVIDNDASVLVGLEAVLEAAGYLVIAARSAAEAVAAMGADGAPLPDVIVADYRLGGGRTGVDAIAAVRQRAGHFIPAALLTGDVDGAVMADAAAHRLDVLAKPISPGELVRAVGGLLPQEYAEVARVA